MSEVVIVKPIGVKVPLDSKLITDRRVRIIEQQEVGLVQAINEGFSLLANCSYWNWCGDDDEVNPSGIDELAHSLHTSDSYIWGLGRSEVKVSRYKISRLSKQTKFKLKLQDWGPNLIVQPSVLFSVSITDRLGRLDENLKCAFDQRLIKEFRNIADPIQLELVTGKYWWHSETLSTQNRIASQKESLALRLHFSRNVLERIFIYMFFPLSFSVIISGHIVIRMLDALYISHNKLKGR